MKNATKKAAPKKGAKKKAKQTTVPSIDKHATLVRPQRVLRVATKRSTTKKKK